jgi:hypothetical protein
MWSSPVAPAPQSGVEKKKQSFPNSDVVTAAAAPDRHTVDETPSNPSGAAADMKSPEKDVRNSFSTTDEETISVDEESGGLHYNILGGNTSDADDDLRSTDDPYTYSDDSASLSDAYFLQSPPLPGSGGLLFGLVSDPESDGDPLMDPTCLLPPRKQRGGSNISSLTNSHSSSSKRHLNHYGSNPHQRHTSSSLSSPIDEDEPVVSEATSLLSNNHTGATTMTVTSFKRRQDRKRRQLRKQRQHLRLQQQKHQQEQQEERERAVTLVRGKRQLATHTDRFWLILFVIQLLFVCYSAVWYGLSLTRPSVTIVPATSDHGPTASILESLAPPHHTWLPWIKSLDPMSHPINVSKTASLPYDHGQDTSLSLSSATTSTTQQNIIDHLQDDDSIQPIIPDDTAPNVKSKAKHKHTIKSSTTATGVTTTTESNGSTTVVVENARFTIDYKNVLSLLLISGGYACLTSYLSFAFMMIVARSLIAIMLVFTILLLLSWGVLGLTVTTYGGSAISILGFALFGLCLAYTMFSWNRIPFCSTNLYTAICAMRSSVLILFAGILSLLVALLWLFVWSIALMGILNKDNGTDCAMWDECETHLVVPNGRLMELGALMISLYWTTMVIKNILRVTVADAIGSWWMQSDSTLFEPFVRACTSSLGTICFGSLVAFPAQLLSVMAGCIFWATGGVFKKSLRWAATPTKRMSSSSEYDGTDGTNNQEADDAPNKQDEVLKAVAKKVSRVNMGNCLQRFGRMLQACNRWSFTYVGMYNYSFLEGGEKAIELFETRQWMDVVRDNLIQNVLVMASIVIGGSSAVVAVVVEEIDGYTFTSMHKPVMTSFWIGFVLGFLLSNILLLGVVGSAVNTVLVSCSGCKYEVVVCPTIALELNLMFFLSQTAGVFCCTSI